jgi:arsenate reductase (thioredoxin)
MSTVDPVTQHQVDARADELIAEFAPAFEARTIREMMADSVARLAETATVGNFLPLLAYRMTKERLRASERVAHRDTADEPHDVVFVSLSGGGRGQIAAALTTRLSRGTIMVHSAGTAVQGRIDPNVSAVISELGIDVSDAFARPITPEVLEATDVVVTMGHSVGVFEIPKGVRHEDWRVGDPVGAPITEVRRVREDIERRVHELLESLVATTTAPV